MSGAVTIAGLASSGADEQPNDYGRWLIHGEQGSGKTTLASTLAELGPMLFIDLVGERGTRSFRGAPYAGNITVIRPESVTALDDVFWELDRGPVLNAAGKPFVSVAIDSVTGVQKMTMRYLLGHSETAVREIRQGTAPADRATWGRSLDVMQDLATFWFGLADAQRAHPMHVVMTAQTKLLDDEFSHATSRTPDVQKGALSIVLAAPDYILYTDVEENLDALNDPAISPVTHVVRFGPHPGYRTKARLPHHLRGKLGPILGRKTSLSLATLSRALEIGGVPKRTPQPAAAPVAAVTTQEEQQ